ncbi:hypothetical protein AVEN_99765-1 [Araneus ventricosus]|uniref:Uncharacterized protein n=1 Tax=Araneus ventricosus TaxID=182803 RepID=A0A4Y2DLK1_ARAVE|nr:hypothetical protein AVEN_99765-1 [Araneus ventricosus]
MTDIGVGESHDQHGSIVFYQPCHSRVTSLWYSIYTPQKEVVNPGRFISSHISPQLMFALSLTTVPCPLNRYGRCNGFRHGDMGRRSALDNHPQLVTNVGISESHDQRGSIIFNAYRYSHFPTAHVCPVLDNHPQLVTDVGVGESHDHRWGDEDEQEHVDLVRPPQPRLEPVADAPVRTVALTNFQMYLERNNGQ